ncbi:hypothetical protein [Gordonia spumicola]|nr:hypothetical protein [Gordonia spumicola]
MTVLDTAHHDSDAPTGARSAPVDAARVRALGITLAVASPLWAAATAVFGEVVDFGWKTVLAGVAALVFQGALMMLLRVQERAGAMSKPGSARRLATIGYRVEYALLAGAVVSTVLDTFVLLHGSVIWAVFDACWPLSMLGMMIIGVRVAIAGRWQGALRWQTLFAQSWLIWGIPLMGLGTVGEIGMVAQVVLGYAALGVMLALHPERTR